MSKTGKRCVRIGKVRGADYEEAYGDSREFPLVKKKTQKKKETVRKVNRHGNSDDWKNFSRELPDRSKNTIKTKKRIAKREIADSGPCGGGHWSPCQSSVCGSSGSSC